VHNLNTSGCVPLDGCERAIWLRPQCDAHQLHAGVHRSEPVKPLQLFLQFNNYLAELLCALAWTRRWRCHAARQIVMLGTICRRFATRRPGSATSFRILTTRGVVPAEAVSSVAEGQTLVVGMAAGQPPALLAAIADCVGDDDVKGLKLYYKIAMEALALRLAEGLFEKHACDEFAGLRAGQRFNRTADRLDFRSFRGTR